MNRINEPFVILLWFIHIFSLHLKHVHTFKTLLLHLRYTSYNYLMWYYNIVCEYAAEHISSRRTILTAAQAIVNPAPGRALTTKTNVQ